MCPPVQVPKKSGWKIILTITFQRLFFLTFKHNHGRLVHATTYICSFVCYGTPSNSQTIQMIRRHSSKDYTGYNVLRMLKNIKKQLGMLAVSNQLCLISASNLRTSDSNSELPAEIRQNRTKSHMQNCGKKMSEIFFLKTQQAMLRS